VPIHSGVFGDIALRGGVTVLLLGDTTSAVNDGNDVDGYAFFGISINR